MKDDLRLSPQVRALLNALDKRVLRIQLSCRYPRVMNQIARLWHVGFNRQAFAHSTSLRLRGH
jgi:hypothetical protein